MFKKDKAVQPGKTPLELVILEGEDEDVHMYKNTFIGIMLILISTISYAEIEKLGSFGDQLPEKPSSQARGSSSNGQQKPEIRREAKAGYLLLKKDIDKSNEKKTAKASLGKLNKSLKPVVPPKANISSTTSPYAKKLKSSLKAKKAKKAKKKPKKKKSK